MPVLEIQRFFQVFHTSENYAESVQMTKYERIFDFKSHVICLISGVMAIFKL